MKDTAALYDEIHGRLALELSSMRHVTDDRLYAMIDGEIAEAERDRVLSVREKITLRSSLFNAFRRLDILQELVDRKEITEIMVNGKDHIFVEQNGRIVRWDRSFKSDEQLEDMIQQIVSRVNRVVNVSTPIADARLEDGSRVHVVLPPVSLGGPVVTIRKFPDPITMEKLIGYGSVKRSVIVGDLITYIDQQIAALGHIRDLGQGHFHAASNSLSVYCSSSVFPGNLRNAALAHESLQLLPAPDQRNLAELSRSPVPESRNLFPVADTAEHSRVLRLLIPGQPLRFLPLSKQTHLIHLPVPGLPVPEDRIAASQPPRHLHNQHFYF